MPRSPRWTARLPRRGASRGARPPARAVGHRRRPSPAAATTVQPGDVIVGDDDGVLVIPPALVAEVVADAIEQERQETFIAEQVAAGERVDGLYPMNAEWKERYRQWQPRRMIESNGAGELQGPARLRTGQGRQASATAATPPGYRLVLGAIAAELDVSAVPVREAIRLLEAEGLVSFERNVGAQVAMIDPAAYRRHDADARRARRRRHRPGRAADHRGAISTGPASSTTALAARLDDFDPSEFTAAQPGVPRDAVRPLPQPAPARPGPARLDPAGRAARLDVQLRPRTGPGVGRRAREVPRPDRRSAPPPPGIETAVREHRRRDPATPSSTITQDRRDQEGAADEIPQRPDPDPGLDRPGDDPVHRRRRGRRREPGRPGPLAARPGLARDLDRRLDRRTGRADDRRAGRRDPAGRRTVADRVPFVPGTGTREARRDPGADRRRPARPAPTRR